MPLSTKRVIELLQAVETAYNTNEVLNKALTDLEAVAIAQAAVMLESGLLPISNDEIHDAGGYTFPTAVDPEVFRQEGRDQATDRVLSEELHLQRYEMMIQQQQITINQLIALLSLALNKGS